jgi:hypothetical protein
MTTSENDSPPATLSRLDRGDEYRVIIENLEQLASRRQSANNVYITLNTLFLTTIGIFISTHLSALNTWSAPIALFALAAVIIPVNVSWLIGLRRYERGNQIRYTYLKDIEDATTPEEAKKGLYHRLEDENLGPQANIRSERFLATYFALFYLLVAITSTVVAALVQSGHIAPLQPF